jgi:Taurine catabolism dioxygenase TauD, TfdA family
MSDTSSSVPFEQFVVTDAPDQRTVDGVRLPFILSPPPPDAAGSSSIVTPDDAVHFVKTHRRRIDEALDQYGAVLFRGFPLEGPKDFDTFVQSWDGWNDLSYDRSMSFAVRKRFGDSAPRICTTNEGKSGGLVFHHEQAQTPLWPSNVFFCCELPAAPGDGGATGLVSSEKVYTELQKRHPDFCRKCEEYGVRYTVYAGPTQDTSKGAGRSWKSFFHVDSKDDCEHKMKAGGWTWEWGVGPSKDSQVGPDFLKCTTPVLECVKVAPGTTKKCFFNQLIATTANALEFSKVGIDGGGYDPLKDVPTQEGIDACVRFGNGDQVPLSVLLEAKQICEDMSIDVQWQKGDVALISNYLMMHARRPWNGPEGTRKLLASLVAEENCTSFGKPLVAL